MRSSSFLPLRPSWRSLPTAWWCTRTRTWETDGTCWILSLLSLGKLCRLLIHFLFFISTLQQCLTTKLVGLKWRRVLTDLLCEWPGKDRENKSNLNHGWNESPSFHPSSLTPSLSLSLVFLPPSLLHPALVRLRSTFWLHFDHSHCWNWRFPSLEPHLMTCLIFLH